MLNKKICMLGASGVGKTSLVKKFVDGIFSEKYLTTIGVKVDKKVVETANDKVQFMLWDIEGTDRYCGFNPRYLRGAAAYLVVVDKTRSQSLIDGDEIRKLAEEVTDSPALLILNKSDLEPMFTLDDPQIKQLEQHFIATIETSAKTGKNVEYAFHCLAEHLICSSES